MKTLILLAILSATFSCTPRAYPPGPNPLDTPGAGQPTAAEIQAHHLRLITGNPGYLPRQGAAETLAPEPPVPPKP